MLRRLSANKDEFIPIEFVSGLNLILAERAPDASDQHSRNARGKTSVLQAINYCLGGNRPTPFRALAEAEWEFSLTLDLFGSPVMIRRSLKSGSRIFVDSAPGDAGRVFRDYQRDDGSISIGDWKYLLGLSLFKLDEGDTDLSARTLLTYVVRLDAPRDPTKIMAQQSAASSREHVAFLLDLDWRVTSELVKLDRDEEAFEALRYASETKLFPGVMRDESELLLRRAEAEREFNELARRGQQFQVLDDPQELISEADRLSSALTTLSDQQVMDRRLLTLYEQSLAEGESTAEVNEGALVAELYSELGLTFSETALARFDQVQQFHSVLSRNRRRFLSAEVDRLTSAIAERERELQNMNGRRSALLRDLASGGGIDDLMEIQRRIAEAQATLNSLDDAIQAVREVSASRDALKVRQATVRRDARADLERVRPQLDRLNTTFAGMIRRLYDRAASITVDIDDAGYKVSVKVAGSSSTGITKMQLACFDLTMMREVSPGRHPLFLVHDSTVFDGVDPRQIAGALTLARETAERLHGQYIATINSNDVPASVSNESWYDGVVRRIILDTEVGGAFGVNF